MAIDLNNLATKNSLDDISLAPKVKKFKGQETAEERIKRQKNEYFTLLTTQLKNQDPLSPMDTAEMTAQIFNINAVEQHLETNKHLEDIKKIFIADHNASHLNYIDKIIDYQGNQVFVDSDKGLFTYNMQEHSGNAMIKIKDLSENVLHTEKVDGKIGMHTFIWQKPSQLPNGIYKFLVTADNANDEQANVTTYSTGKVKSLLTKGGKHYFEVNDQMISVDDAVKIKSGAHITVLNNEISKDMKAQLIDKVKELISEQNQSIL